MRRDGVVDDELDRRPDAGPLLLTMLETAEVVGERYGDFRAMRQDEFAFETPR